MTCGESRFVFTVINALCNSLKPIKEAEVFFLPPPPLVFNILKFKIFCFPVLLWLHENGSVTHTLYMHNSVSLFSGSLDSCRYIWLTVHTIEMKVSKFMHGI